MRDGWLVGWGGGLMVAMESNKSPFMTYYIASATSIGLTISSIQ